ncbi:MAG TPA: ester cyclase [Candidatus Angelobacter sp.]
MADNKSLVHRWFEEVWNQGRERTIDELLGKDIVAFGLGEAGTEVHGPAEFKTFFKNLRNAFPDLHITIEDTLAERDEVAVRILIEGTHKGDGLGIPATEKKFRVSGICVIKLANGKLVVGWNSWDQLGLLQQLGVVPAPKEDPFLEAR